jgi:uncharacterized membrane protein
MPEAVAVAVPPAVEASRWVAVGSVLALIVLGLAWELWLDPTPPRPIWALKVIPLCFAVVGLLKRRMYTYRWVSLLVWPYFIEGVVRATSSRGPSVSLAALETFLTLVLFAACVVHVRLRLRKAKS